MIEAYKIGVSLVVDSNATQQVGKMTDAFKALGTTIQRIQGSVNEMAAAMRVMSKMADQTAASWVKAATAMERAATASGRAAAASGFGGGGGGGGASTGGSTSANAPAPGGGPRRIPLAIPYMPNFGNGGGLVPSGGFGGGLVSSPLLLAGPSSGGGLAAAGGSGGGVGRGPLNLISPGGGAGGGTGAPRFGAIQMLEAVGFYEAFALSMKEELNLTIAAIDLGFKKGSPGFDKVMESLRNTANTSTKGTKFSEGVAAAAMPELSRIFASMMPEFGSAEIVEKFNSIFPIALRGAEVAEMMGLGKVNSTMPAYMEYAHMTGTYSGPELEKRLNTLRNVASATNHSAAQEESILKYSVPIAMAAGIDPDNAAIMTGFFQQMGFNSSTAGTGLSQMILALTEKEGSKKHKAALHAMGIRNSNGKLQVLDADGHIDMIKVMDKIIAYRKTHTDDEALQADKDIFGTRGGRLAGVIKDQADIDKAVTFRRNIAGGPTAIEAQRMLGETTMQLFEQNTARVSDIFNNMGRSVLPALNAAFAKSASILGSVSDKMHDDPATAAGGAAAGIGAMLLGVVGLAPKLLKRFGLGSGAPVGGALAGAARTAGGLGVLFGLGSMIEGGAESATDAASNVTSGPDGRKVNAALKEYRATHSLFGMISDYFSGTNPDAEMQRLLHGSNPAGGDRMTREPAVIKGDVNLDGQKVGTWLGRAVGSTASGGTPFDFRNTPMPTGAAP